MTGTSRIGPRRAPTRTQKADKFVATCSGEEVARQARVEELRRMVAAGEYRVEPEVLAESILRRALSVKAE